MKEKMLTQLPTKQLEKQLQQRGINTFTISEAGTYTLVLKLTKTATGSANAPKDISFRVDWK